MKWKRKWQMLGIQLKSVTRVLEQQVHELSEEWILSYKWQNNTKYRRISTGPGSRTSGVRNTAAETRKRYGGRDIIRTSTDKVKPPKFDGAKRWVTEVFSSRRAVRPPGTCRIIWRFPPERGRPSVPRRSRDHKLKQFFIMSGDRYPTWPSTRPSKERPWRCRS
jgi:hypothetical protein